MTLKFETGRDFCTMHLTTKFHHPTFNSSEDIVLTNKQTQKDTAENIHLLLYATPMKTSEASKSSSSVLVLVNGKNFELTRTRTRTRRCLKLKQVLFSHLGRAHRCSYVGECTLSLCVCYSFTMRNVTKLLRNVTEAENGRTFLY